MTSVADVGQVEAALRALVEHADGPFVVKLPRAPGARDARYAHPLSGELPVPAAAPESSEPAASRSGLAERVQHLEAQVERLQRELEEIRGRLPQ